MASDATTLRRKLEKACRKNGWEFVDSKGKHQQVICPRCGEKLALPNGTKILSYSIKAIRVKFSHHGIRI